MWRIYSNPDPHGDQEFEKGWDAVHDSITPKQNFLTVYDEISS
jgi:hypothetical protein